MKSRWFPFLIVSLLAFMLTIGFFWLPQPLLASAATDNDPDDAAVIEVAKTDVVINELHYAPDNQTEFIEFVELFNRSSMPIDLSKAAN